MHATHIENVHIHLPPLASSEALAAMERIMAGLGRAEPGSAHGGHAAATQHATTSTDTPPAHGELWPGQGGYYICTLPATFGLPARHLIAAAAEQVGLQWGGYNHDTPAASSKTDGHANTAALLQDQHKHPAAEWAAAHTADGHADFHLPSQHDLFMCCLHAPQLFQKSGWYWSSTQSSRGDAYCQDFEYGYSVASLEDDEFRARPVRWVQLQPFNT